MERRVIKEPASVQTQDKNVLVSGGLGVEDFHRLLAAIHDRVNDVDMMKLFLTSPIALPRLRVPCLQFVPR